MLRVQLEINGDVHREWQIEENDYVVNTTTATTTSFLLGKEHVYLFDGNKDYNYSSNRIDNNVLDGCTGHIDTANTTYAIASQNTSGETVHLVTSGWATSTANITILYWQAPIQAQYSFAIQAGYTE